MDEAWVTMERAFDYFIEAGDVSGAVAAAEYPLFYVPGFKDATGMVTETLALVPAGSRTAVTLGAARMRTTDRPSKTCCGVEKK